jgi:molybdenum cofactor cytidylyltransferase
VPPEGEIGAVVLAAGASRRFGEPNKLLAKVDGRALIERVLDALNAVGVTSLVVVTGWDPEPVAQVSRQRGASLIHNPDWESGMGSSIGAGIAGLDGSIAAVLIVPGDMPLVTSEAISTLIDAFERDGGNRVVYPTTRAGEQRNPVLWPRRFFGDLGTLPAAEGAKSLLQRLPVEDRHAVTIGDEDVFVDVDTEAQLLAVQERERGA